MRVPTTSSPAAAINEDPAGAATQLEDRRSVRASLLDVQSDVLDAHSDVS